MPVDPRTPVIVGALVWANGGYLTKHFFWVDAAEPPPHGFRHERPQREIDDLPVRSLAAGDEATAATATVETYTEIHERDGAPHLAVASCLLPDGRRAWRTSTDSATAAALTDGEWVGRNVHIDATGALHA
jgi:acetyl-CoA C-acetyltransferase